MISSQICNKIYDSINDSSNVFLVSDKRTDGDSLGSVVAMSLYLNKIGKKNTIFVANDIPSQLKYLVENICYKTSSDEIDFENFDLFIACDFGSIEQSGIADQLVFIKESSDKVLINIDHHATNTCFGDINLVMGDVGANTEIIFFLLDFLGCKVDKDIATALLTGLITDTNNFCNAATTHSLMKVASKLVLKGGRINKIVNHTQRNKSVEMLRLWGKMLLRLNKKPEMDMAVTLLTKKDLVESKLNYDSVDGIVDFLNSLDQTDAVLVLREECDCIKGSLRTTKDHIDVSKMARLFGGGGHKKAAGFTFSGNIIESSQGWQIE